MNKKVPVVTQEKLKVPTVMKYKETYKKRVPGNAKVLRRDFVPELGYGQSIAPLNGYGEGSSIYMKVYGNDVFVDTNRSYLSFSAVFNNTGTVNAYLEGSAYSFIDNIKIYDETTGALLEEIRNYGEHVNKMSELNMSYNEKMFSGTFAGFDDYYGSRVTIPAGTQETINFHLPLIGIGSMNISSPYHGENGVLFPLAFLNKGLRFVITLVSNINNIIIWDSTMTPLNAASQTISFALNNFKYSAICTQMDPTYILDMKNDLMDDGNPNIYVSSYTYKTQVIEQDNTELNFPLTINAKSIKSIFTWPFNQEYFYNTATGYQLNEYAYKLSRKTASPKYGFKNYQAIINNESYPSFPLTEISDIWGEVSNAIGKAQGTIDYSNYTNSGHLNFDDGVPDVIINDKYYFDNKFVAGLDLESVQATKLLNGYDNSKDYYPIMIRANVEPYITSNGAVTPANVNSTKFKFMISALIDTVIKFDLSLGSVSIEY